MDGHLTHPSAKTSPVERQQLWSVATEGKRNLAKTFPTQCVRCFFLLFFVVFCFFFAFFFFCFILLLLLFGKIIEGILSAEGVRHLPTVAELLTNPFFAEVPVNINTKCTFKVIYDAHVHTSKYFFKSVLLSFFFFFGNRRPASE